MPCTPHTLATEQDCLCACTHSPTYNKHHHTMHSHTCTHTCSHTHEGAHLRSTDLTKGWRSALLRKEIPTPRAEDNTHTGTALKTTPTRKSANVPASLLIKILIRDFFSKAPPRGEVPCLSLQSPGLHSLALQPTAPRGALASRLVVARTELWEAPPPQSALAPSAVSRPYF